MANKIVKIGDWNVGEDNFVFMIGEIGINHNGDMNIAKKLIDAAFACSWHSIKFQKRTPSLCVPEDQKNIMRDTPWGKMTYLNYKYKVEFEKKEYDFIDEYCKAKPITWSVSIWDLPSLDFIVPYKVPYIKIPSAKITEHELLKKSAESKIPVIISTGMSNLEEVDEAVNLLEKYSNGDYILLHTNSAYPTPVNELNLKMIETLKDRYKCVVGYSGHEFDLEPSVIAVSLGAKVVERHITLDHNMWGTDQKASLEVHAMDLLNKRIKNIDLMLGNGEKKVMNSEIDVRKKLRG